MPRRKITIEEAFAALQEQGIQVQVKPPAPVVEQPVPQLFEQPSDPVQYTSVQPVGSSKRQVKINLYAQHSIGCGGVDIKDSNGKVTGVEQAGVQSYGPGAGIVVPAHLASQLLYQDAQARRADDNMLDRTQRSFLVVQKTGRGGQSVNIGVEVQDGMVEPWELVNLPPSLVHILKQHL